MGACMDKTQDKKKKKHQISVPNHEPRSFQPQINPRKFSESSKHDSIMKASPKYKKMSVNELLVTYRIQSTLLLSSKMEGPKYLSNIVDGSSKVLRIVNLDDIDEKRLDTYKQNVGLQIYQNDQGSLMILDEYCSGEDLYELTDRFKQSKEEASKKELLKFTCEIFAIVTQFHRNKVWLGNLNLSSFKRVSNFRQEVRLVDFNLTGHVTEFQKMGFAFKETFEADYEFLGYLIQFLVSEEPPIFISHKMQYVEYEKYSQSALIQTLLKGKKPNQADISQLNSSQIIINEKASLGYRLRRDINKLLKMRKKRKGHNRKFYGEDTVACITEVKFNEEAVYRLETQRITERIRSYIYRVKSIHEEAFFNYAGNNDNLRQLKEVFLLTEEDKKMAQLRECLSNIMN